VRACGCRRRGGRRSDGKRPPDQEEFLDAGLGYGGHSFPKELQAFENLAARLGYDFRLLREVERINSEAVEAAFDKVKDALRNLEGRRIALLGLSFKPDTGDVRFSLALALARQLLDEEAIVVGYDPQAGVNAKSVLARLELAPTPYGAIEGAHCTVVCTEWDEFRLLDLDPAKKLFTHPIVVDGRNVFDPSDMRARGFAWHGARHGWQSLKCSGLS
jgi:UDPglucose 6-dehydrogenase